MITVVEHCYNRDDASPVRTYDNLCDLIDYISQDNFAVYPLNEPLEFYQFKTTTQIRTKHVQLIIFGMTKDDNIDLYQFIETNYIKATFYETDDNNPVFPMQPTSRTVLQNIKY